MSEEIDIVQNTADEHSSDDIVVLIPAFNESLVIGSVVLQARKYASRVIVVDDGSADNTSEVAGLAGAEVITMPQNVGKASAMMAGFATEASGMAGTMQNMNAGINDIATTIDESANAVTTVATDASELVEAMVEIQNETHANREISAEMSSVVNRFKKL